MLAKKHKFPIINIIKIIIMNTLLTNPIGIGFLICLLIAVASCKITFSKLKKILKHPDFEKSRMLQDKHFKVGLVGIICEISAFTLFSVFCSIIHKSPQMIVITSLITLIIPSSFFFIYYSLKKKNGYL